MTHLRAFLPLLALPLAACVGEGDQSVVIIQNNVPSEGCTVSASADSTFYASGQIDIRSDEGYFLTPVVQNFATANTAADEQRRIAFVQGALVDLSFADPDLFSDEQEAQLRADGLTRFDVPLAGAIGAGGTTSFGFEIVPKAVMDAMGLAAGGSELVLATVRLYGEMGGSDFESQSFRYAVEVCDGCLAINQGACTTLPSNFEPRTGGACNLFQDGVIDCCSVGTTLFCPAQPPAE